MENEIEIICDFSDPVFWSFENQVWESVENSSSGDPIWNFQKMTCSGTSSAPNLEMIKNTTTGSEFYISKSINYGDILISFFLLLFIIFGVFKFLVDFVIPKFMNFKRS